MTDKTLWREYCPQCDRRFALMTWRDAIVFCCHCDWWEGDETLLATVRPKPRPKASKTPHYQLTLEL
ncbi:MAG: hypothetical protein AAGG53_00945 [Cyanobacteria bacterium P01_H01_bin.152]